MKQWILDKWKDGQTDYSLCVICKKKGFKRTWLKIAGHISGSECFREIKRDLQYTFSCLYSFGT